jgi:hypothetical protein
MPTTGLGQCQDAASTAAQLAEDAFTAFRYASGLSQDSKALTERFTLVQPARIIALTVPQKGDPPRTKAYLNQLQLYIANDLRDGALAFLKMSAGERPTQGEGPQVAREWRDAEGRWSRCFPGQVLPTVLQSG